MNETKRLFNTLYYDVAVYMASFLEQKDLTSLAKTCRMGREIVTRVRKAAYKQVHDDALGRHSDGFPSFVNRLVGEVQAPIVLAFKEYAPPPLQEGKRHGHLLNKGPLYFVDPDKKDCIKRITAQLGHCPLQPCQRFPDKALFITTETVDEICFYSIRKFFVGEICLRTKPLVKKTRAFVHIECPFNDGLGKNLSTMLGPNGKQVERPGNLFVREENDLKEIQRLLAEHGFLAGLVIEKRVDPPADTGFGQKVWGWLNSWK